MNYACWKREFQHCRLEKEQSSPRLGWAKKEHPLARIKAVKPQEKRTDMGVYASKKPRADGSRAGWSMERGQYKDPEVFEREKSAILYNCWIFAGHVSQIPEKGNFFVFNLLDESAIVVRSSDGAVRAHFNVCRHRGSVICKEKSGKTKLLTCPYHAWSYDLDGNLISARGMPDEVDISEFGLHPCPIEIIDGLIFLNFADQPSSLDRARKDLKEPMAMYDFANMKVAAHKNYPIAANWKVTLENYQECYHCAPSHPEYSLSHTLKVDETRFDELQEPMMERLEACGLRHFEVDGQFDLQPEGQEQFGYSRYALFESYKTGSQDGEQLAPLLGAIKGFDHGASDINIGPLTYFLAYNDHVVVYVFTPTDHETSAADIYWLVRSDAEEGKDYDVEKLTWLWHVTTLADERIIVDTQKGINSQRYVSGPLSKMEYLIDRYITWYLEAMNRE